MSTPGTSCSQPGCQGRIADGYCDVCGAPAVAAPARRAARGKAGATSPSTVPPLPTSPPTTVSATAKLPTAALGTDRLGLAAVGRTRRADSTQRSRAGGLGAGLVTVAPVRAVDPAGVVMKDAVVPEDRRICPACGGPVGRSSPGRPGRVEGFCPTCRAPYSFTPKLAPGDLVAGQYHVVGALAHGGLGWVYLAQDRNVSDRWVVLKGLLNAGDRDAYAAAVAERQFLAQVEHPLIVEIYNFVRHGDAGYIVMEYVGGISLKAMLKQRQQANHGDYDPLPVETALAYMIAVLPAFSFLHGQGLIYCDFKPDNLIQVGDDVKLIDLGGVRRVDDLDSAIYGTVGYQAPEVASLGPSVAGDVYTIGRTLAVLTFEFRGYQSIWADALPPVADVPVLAANDSFARVLAKACDVDPADRFQSAEELRDQLVGVLREKVSTAPGAPAVAVTSAVSRHFETPAITTDVLTWELLPALRLDPADPGAAWLSALTVSEPAALVSELIAAPVDSVGVKLALARAALLCQEWQLAHETVDAVLEADPWQWQAAWTNGLAHLAKGDADAAAGAFNAVYSQLPGEIAPKLALAHACETTVPAAALDLFRTCLRTDAGYAAPAAFGLARVHTREGRLDDALAALDLVPTTSRAYGLARRTKVDLLIEHGSGIPDLRRALALLDPLPLAAEVKAAKRVAVHERILAAQLKAAPATPEAEETATRASLEQALRDLARYTDDDDRRTELIERANQVRPLTWQ